MKCAFTTLLLASVAAGDCAADNCLRAVRTTQSQGSLGAARESCASATFEAGNVASTAIPSYALNGCKHNQNSPLSARLSSACDCVAATASSLPSVTATSTKSRPLASISTTSSTTSKAASTPTNSLSATSTFQSASESPTQACALVSSSSAVQKAASPSAIPTVAAQLAHACLNSVPLNKAAALQLVDSMVPYIEWQSDTAWKKNPPADYFHPPHDIFGYLASVKANLQADKYANEYKFQEDLYQVFVRAHDGHFFYYPDALTRFEWGRQRSLVSISEDGTSLPVIKLYEDVIASPSTASVVTQINGIDASKYVADFIFAATFNQDADAAYNTMFYTKALAAGGHGNGYFSSGGRTKYIYPGSHTTFTFANGTTLVTENIAIVEGDFDAVTDGASFYTQFCLPESSIIDDDSEEESEEKDADEEDADEEDADEEDADEEDADEEVVTPGYPAPILINSDGDVSGYYLNGTGFEDVAVISLLSFASSDSVMEYQAVVQNFFATAKRDGKTKLVVDLSANGGGYVLHGYDLFRQLFPSIVQDGNTRFRESDTFLAIAEIYSANAANAHAPNATEDIRQQYESPFNYRSDLNLTNQPFLSFKDKFGPKVIDGVNYTEVMRLNLENEFPKINETNDDVTGYGSRKNFTQPFAAENIIMLFDGICASTCASFAEFMRIQAGVKSIAMGGRPQPGPIQGIGGGKGAQYLTWYDIFEYAKDALRTASEAQAAILRRFTKYPIHRTIIAAINILDTILPDNLDDGLPAQFVREEADCRLFYTRAMVMDITALWKAAADAAFNGAKCVAGGISRRAVNKNVENRRVVTPTMKKPLKKRSTKKMAANWCGSHGHKAIL